MRRLGRFAAGLAALMTSPSALTYAGPYGMVGMRSVPRKPSRPLLQESERGDWSLWLDSDGARYLRRRTGRRVEWFSEQVPTFEPAAAEALLARIDGSIHETPQSTADPPPARLQRAH
jgi:hypothetical protein